MNRPSELETRLAAAVADQQAAPERIAELLAGLAPAERFFMREHWLRLALDTGLDTARRRLAFQLLIEHATPLPQAFDAFFQEAVAPLGAGRDGMVEMSMAHVLPVAREAGCSVWLIPLPFATPLGQVGLYVRVRRDDRMVEQAALSPGGIDAFRGGSDGAR